MAKKITSEEALQLLHYNQSKETIYSAKYRKTYR